MTTITVPRATWDALREALESVGKALPLGQSTVKTCYAINNIHRDAVHAALTAANAVSAPKGLFVDLIASHGPEFVAEMADLSLIGEGDMLAKQPEILAEYTGINGAMEASK